MVEVTIYLRGEPYVYCVRESTRAKRHSIVVDWEGKLEVVVPVKKKYSQKSIERILKGHEDWVVRNVKKQRKNGGKTALTHKGIPRQIVERNTKAFVMDRIDYYSRLYGFSILKVDLRNYKSQWGSCSRRSRLGLHYKISLLPNCLGDYIVVHELCHTKHFNHSASFWGLVGSFCPEYKQHRKELRKYLL